MTKASVAAAILKSIEKPPRKRWYGRKWVAKKDAAAKRQEGR